MKKILQAQLILLSQKNMKENNKNQINNCFHISQCVTFSTNKTKTDAKHKKETKVHKKALRVTRTYNQTFYGAAASQLYDILWPKIVVISTYDYITSCKYINIPHLFSKSLLSQFKALKKRHQATKNIFHNSLPSILGSFDLVVLRLKNTFRFL